uniref:RloB-like protein n=1 Tax=Candidatus Kentrum sp. TUN TaxID=2126343 RepID=A0A450ZMW7_9GAMM|nr:MAG: RloB-like protein [Candidatus Kentron sp. TUN]
MRKYIEENSLKSSDEAWLVVDKDKWRDDQLIELHRWSQEADNYGLALSNPKFEYWLLLHFEEGTGVANSRDCTKRLQRHLPGYEKGIDSRKITREMISKAIERAKRRDTPPCTDWPRTTGTTVYKLVEHIQKAETSVTP